MEFREDAIKDNVDIALIHVTFDMTDNQWFDSKWVASRVYNLGHNVTEAFVEHWLREKAEAGWYEREYNFFRVV